MLCAPHEFFLIRFRLRFLERDFFPALAFGRFLAARDWDEHFVSENLVKLLNSVHAHSPKTFVIARSNPALAFVQLLSAQTK